jgi:hypothetical protein
MTRRYSHEPHEKHTVSLHPFFSERGGGRAECGLLHARHVWKKYCMGFIKANPVTGTAVHAAWPKCFDTGFVLFERLVFPPLLTVYGTLEEFTNRPIRESQFAICHAFIAQAASETV